MLQLDDQYHENLTVERLDGLLDSLRNEPKGTP